MARKRLINAFLCLAIVFTASLPQGCVHESVAPVDGSGGPGPNPEPEPEPEIVCDPNVVYYNQVQDILTSNCTESGCHSGSNPPEGINLTSYEALMNSDEDEEDLIVPGNPGASELYEMITEDDPEDWMPRGKDKLPAEQIALIRKWIQQGAKSTTCVPSSCDTTNVTYTASIKPIMTKCTGCHGNTTQSGGFNFTQVADLQRAAAQNKLIPAIRWTGSIKMPMGGAQLPECDIRKIEIWVEGGALNN